MRAALRPIFGLPALERQNYRGRTVATAAGVVVPFTVLLVEAGSDVAGSFDVRSEITTARALLLLTAVAFGFLGLLDDVVGSGHAQGFRGHVRELGHGRLTTGGVKLVGGAAAALAIVSGVDGGSPGHLFADAALVALAANLGNQLDRRPGRVTKVGVATFVVLVVAIGAPRPLQAVAVVVGATAALIIDDLRERLMLGDVGANVLGACLGLGVVLSCSFAVRLGVLAAMAVLNLVGEVSSFTRIIEAVPPLRALPPPRRWV